MKNHICPVCGYPKLEEKPYNKFGDPSFEICPCCGTEFGYQDFVGNKKKNLPKKWASLRKSWLGNGAKWWSKSIKKPKNWNLKSQLKNLK